MKLLIIPVALAGLACAEALPLIPLPVSIKSQEGAFDFSPAAAIRYERGLKVEADLFAADLMKLTGTSSKLVAEELRILLPSEIRFDIDAAADFPAGGYKLKISPKTVVVTGKDAAGV